MGIRERKKLKSLLPWGETKSDRTGTDAGGERVGSGSSPARPVPHVVEGGGHDRGGNDDESNSNWKATTSAAAKLLLRGVKDSAAAFGPLQSVAGALCFILDNCEVRPLMHTIPIMLTGVQENEGEQASDRVVGTPCQGDR